MTDFEMSMDFVASSRVGVKELVCLRQKPNSEFPKFAVLQVIDPKDHQSYKIHPIAS